MKSNKNVRIVVAALVGVVVLAGVGWVAARQIRSPRRSPPTPPRRRRR